jgi:hypothetical protein
LWDGDGAARGQIVAVKRDVEGAYIDRGGIGLAFGEFGGEALGDQFAAGADADQGEGFGGDAAQGFIREEAIGIVC